MSKLHSKTLQNVTLAALFIVPSVMVAQTGAVTTDTAATINQPASQATTISVVSGNCGRTDPYIGEVAVGAKHFADPI